VKNGFDLTSILSNLKFFLADSPQKLPAEILQFLQNLPAMFDPQSLAKNLPAAMTLLGILHETGLKNLLSGKIDRTVNLKWLLLALETMKNAQSSSPESENAPSNLNDLEAVQLRNLPLSRFLENDTTYLQIPVWHQNNWERLDVFFRSHSPAQNLLDKNNVSIRINLDSQNLGKLSALADIQNGALTVSLYFENPAVSAFIQPQLEQLEKSLQTVGYDVRGLSAQSMPPEMSAEPAFLPRVSNHENLNLLA